MTIPKQMLRMVVTESTYRLAHRLKQVLVLADYQGRNIFEVIEANELLQTLRQAAPIHVAMLTPAIIPELDQNGLHTVLQNEFPDVALLYLGEKDGQAQQSRMKLIPDHVFLPPFTADSFDEAIAAALQNRDNRKQAMAYIAQGETAWSQGAFQEAQASFEAAVRLGGPDPYPAYVLGERFTEMGDTKQAIVYFTQAWEKNPTYFAAVKRIVALLFAQGERIRAIPYLEQVSQQDLAPVEDLVALGTLYIETGAAEQATTVLQRACRVHASEAVAAMQESFRDLMARNADAEAATLLQIGIDAQPENDQLYGMLGDLYMKQDRYREALVCYENVTRCGDPTPATYCQLARIYLALGFALRAEKAVQLALELDPESEEAAQLRVAVVG